MHLLLLMLDDARLSQPLLDAWTKAGIRGVYVMESIACNLPAEGRQERGSAGFMPFASLFGAGQRCYIIMLAAVETQAKVEEAAAAAARVVGPWGENPGIAMLSLPVEAYWGTPLAAPSGAGE